MQIHAITLSLSLSLCQRPIVLKISRISLGFVIVMKNL